MSLSLPDSVSTWFRISSPDIAQISNCFTQDAVVIDEEQTYRGHAAILDWKRETQKKYTCTAEPVSANQNGEHLSVAVNVAGHFPGSPVQLNYVFILVGNKIASLEIN